VKQVLFTILEDFCNNCFIDPYLVSKLQVLDSSANNSVEADIDENGRK